MGESEKILGQNCPSAKNTGSCDEILNIEEVNIEEVEERRTVACRERRTVASREPKREGWGAREREVEEREVEERRNCG